MSTQPPPNDKAIEKSKAVEKAVASVPISTHGMAASNSTELWAIAKIMSNGMGKIKPNMTQDEKDIIYYGTAAMIQAGYEVGLSPLMSTRALYAVNGRPAWMLEGLTAVMRSRGVIAADDPDAWTYHFENEPQGYTQLKDWPNDCTCVVRLRRKGWTTHKEARFSVGDAKLAGLWGKGGPWSNYPKRQLYARAGGFLARDYCSDVTLGIPVVEELRDIQIHESERPKAEKKPDNTPLNLSAPLVVDAEVVEPKPAEEKVTFKGVPVEYEKYEPGQPAAADLEFSLPTAIAELRAASNASTDDPAAQNDLWRDITGGKAPTSEAEVEAAYKRLAEHPLNAQGGLFE